MLSNRWVRIGLWALGVVIVSVLFFWGLAQSYDNGYGNGYAHGIKVQPSPAPAPAPAPVPQPTPVTVIVNPPAVNVSVNQTVDGTKSANSQPPQQVLFRTAYINGSGGFNIGQSGDYKIILNPPMPGTSISIDGRAVYNYQIFYLYQGWHTVYSNSPVQISWQLNY
ncbi:MAG: hypothetical protein A2654_03015 [Candidatus Nealsonbacteria bacterium RIFCSPHIGHO2_01_FULL_43_31]|uniref:Uncharacterized protein n=1 Tax=Candidatus Nealsonbacteria bacterium RIFCSPHIGHO2_01_FULL_43_31 TaxID=1801665 RepID=A0A1G2E2Q4_9BACT|nr:MAG: hypothetical protein UV98_C0008G0004 [Parcubacteria group bacterium GW2011_GWB1_43_6]OGZ19531.1 MAG: hypothetical protein A2654_03015 [Candidatus Nealsonbacteria bacterium RIFCSPHIGHO2_01_FULL_43_31]OGZ24697.1 MAG: hypothetical protein A2922_00315 [Candidatus Nealsonbacteria bacterium RIFCSPLOWO2_01_FULL_43_36]